MGGYIAVCLNLSPAASGPSHWEVDEEVVYAAAATSELSSTGANKDEEEDEDDDDDDEEDIDDMNEEGRRDDDACRLGLDTTTSCFDSRLTALAGIAATLENII